MAPSRIRIMRFAFFPTLASWVISMTVRHSSWSDLNISRTSSHVFESRAPVGSSARSTEGDQTIALAIATRCCCHPESSVGLLWIFSASQTRISASLAIFSALPLAIFWYSSGSMTCSSAESLVMRLYHWKMKPTFFPRNSASSLSENLLVSIPSRKYVPPLGLSRRPMIFIRVDFPLPDGPMIATNSPSLMVRLISLSTSKTSFQMM